MQVAPRRLDQTLVVGVPRPESFACLFAAPRAPARNPRDEAASFFDGCWVLLLMSAMEFSASLRCASAFAFLQISLIEGVSATGTVASSFILERPPTPSHGA